MARKQQHFTATGCVNIDIVSFQKLKANSFADQSSFHVITCSTANNSVGTQVQFFQIVFKYRFTYSKLSFFHFLKLHFILINVTKEKEIFNTNSVSA